MKELVGEQALQIQLLKKKSESVGRGWHRRMEGMRKANLIEKVESQRGRRLEILRALQIPRSTYYQWRKVYKEEGILGLQRVRTGGKIWNRLLAGERERVLEIPETFGKSFDIGGNDVLSYYEMLKFGRIGLIKKFFIRFFSFLPLYPYLGALVPPSQ